MSGEIGGGAGRGWGAEARRIRGADPWRAAGARGGPAGAGGAEAEEAAAPAARSSYNDSAAD